MAVFGNDGNGGVIMPAGRYAVGDPCYHLGLSNSREWDAFLEQQQEGHAGEFGGRTAWAADTAHGDGEYYDDEGRNYGVDAGMIGVVGMLEGEQVPDGMWEVVFERPFPCGRGGGVIVIGNLRIDTDPRYVEEPGEEEENADLSVPGGMHPR